MPAPIKGDKLSLMIDSHEYNADLSSYKLSFEEADKDALTFADLAAGVGDKGILKVTALQSTDAAALWRICWENAGRTSVPFVIAPHANPEAAAAKPHITGKLDFGLRPEIGGDADPKKVFTFDYEFECQVDKELKVS